MSDSIFDFTLTCPHCAKTTRMADGFETDDWTEVFVFSGTGPFQKHTCAHCGQATSIDELYARGFVAPDHPERITAYFDRMLGYVLEHGGIYDHGWDPDVETALRRYASLDSRNGQLQRLRKLYYYAFHDRKKLTKCEPHPGTRVTTPDLVLHPGLLKKIYLPDSLAEVGDGTFRNCGGLNDAFIPKNVVRIGESAFENCFGLQTLRTPDSLLVIAGRAFFGCRRLGRLFLPAGIREIGAEAFRGCAGLKRVYLPAGILHIGENAFADCPGLVIAGKPGTAGEAYAIANGIPFAAE